MSWATKRFGKLTILKETSPNIFLCKCDCGNTVEVWFSLLDGNVQRHCGCRMPKQIRKSRTGHMRTYKTKKGVIKYWTSAEHNSWTGMNNRCYVPSNMAYKDYGGRGITVCERWRRGVGPRGLAFKNFLEDMGPRPSGMTLDRINPQHHYEPTNCRWADDTMQAENKRRNLWKDQEPPPVESVRVMETRVQEQYDELNPY